MFIAVTLALVIPFGVQTAVVAAAVGAGQHFYAREKRDTEVVQELPQPALSAYNPFTWRTHELLESIPTVGLAVAAIVAAWAYL